MRKPDFQKTSSELESDSCFDLLTSCNERIVEVEAKLAELREQAKALQIGTIEEHVNYSAKREYQGERLGLAYMQGALEAHCKMKTDLAAIVRVREASQVVA